MEQGDEFHHVPHGHTPPMIKRKANNRRARPSIETIIGSVDKHVLAGRMTRSSCES